MWPIYHISRGLNLLHFEHSYPREPRTLGERLRKARMERGLIVRELAGILGVSEDTILNWEVRGRNPAGRNLGKVLGFIDGKPR